MRVVLDTNFWLSAIFTRGVCEAVLDRCIDRPDLTIVCCGHILDEFSRTAVSAFGVSRTRAEDAVGFIRRNAEIVVPADVPPESCRDPDDLPILGAAIAGKAEAIVTGDADLLSMKEFRGVAIVSPREFYERAR